MRTRPYSYFLTRIAGLMGMSSDDLQDDEKQNILGFFNRAIRDGWERTNWPELCPYGEARFLGNMLPSANDYRAPNWGIGTGDTIQFNAFANPMDGQRTAALYSEGSYFDYHVLV